MKKIWNKLLLKLGVYFYGLVNSKEVLLESNNHIETNLDKVVENIGVQSSVSF